MIVLSWNYRGVEQPAIVPSLCELVKNNNVTCSLLSYSLNHIDMEVVEGTITSRIMALVTFNSLPYVIIGDFNDLLCDRHKSGSVPHSLHLFRGFCEAVDAYGVWDVDLIGHPYTWSHGQGSPNFVEECLDRAMGNSQWHDLFPNLKLYSLVAPTSDHSPILLDMSPIVVRHKFKSFKF
ncbi:hypothetical protein ACS0TY_007579 [Phlomoides rotata]